MHKSFPFQCIFSMSLPTFRKGVVCTKALHPLTRAVRAVQCAVRFSTLSVGRILGGPSIESFFWGGGASQGALSNPPPPIPICKPAHP